MQGNKNHQSKIQYKGIGYVSTYSGSRRDVIQCWYGAIHFMRETLIYLEYCWISDAFMCGPSSQNMGLKDLCPSPDIIMVID